jgi:N-acetylglucosaminyldiphosphoundecaprenol N-acetyl-beta-D-mannosaminyltransferase
MRIKLFGLYIDNLTMLETLSRVEEMIKSRQPHQHVVVNVNKVVQAYKNDEIKNIINSCDLVNVDGMPVVWASYLFGKGLKEKVSGIDLFLNLIKLSAKKGYKVFFLGAAGDIVEKTVEIFKRQYPSLRVAGYHHGYWKAEEESSVIDFIAGCDSDILFVAIPSPQKEIFNQKYLNRLNIPFVMGVGGSFDVVAGKTKRAPGWMQKSGLEWFYRFIQEPRRLFKRYFVEGARFFYIIFHELVFSRKIDN